MQFLSLKQLKCVLSAIYHISTRLFNTDINFIISKKSKIACMHDKMLRTSTHNKNRYNFTKNEPKCTKESDRRDKNKETQDTLIFWNYSFKQLIIHIIVVIIFI